MSRDEVYVYHILEAIEKIERYTKGLTRESLAKDDLRIDGVIRELEVIGEAVGNLSDEFRTRHRKIPYEDIIGMRNRLIHEYFGVNLGIVWETITGDLPRLKELLQPTAKT
jgi:uncharacterized protein with HEPN domain